MDDLSEAQVREAHQALEDLQERRPQLRHACESAVVRWQWATENSDLHRPQPLYRERHGLRPPTLLETAPASPRDEQQYGIDADGEIVVAREYVGPQDFREELRVRRGDLVVGYRWMETGLPAEVNLAYAAGERLQSYVTIWPEGMDMMRGTQIERYLWDGDRLDEIHSRIAISFDDTPPQPELTRIRATYDESGNLVELREHGDRGEKVLFRAPGSGPSIATLQRRVEDRLVELVPELVREHAREPIYCVALHYELEWPLPPNVAVGIERDRRAWLRDVDDAETLRLTVWNPAEFSSYAGESVGGPLTDIDAELAAALAELAQDGEESRAQGRATLNRAARRLQKLDWRSIAPVTEDLVVFAVDLELTHLDENLRYSVPAALRRRLAAQRLL